MASQLRVSEHWYSKITNGHRPISDDLMLRLDDLLRRSGVVLGSTLNSGDKPATLVEEPRVTFGRVASRIPLQRSPSTRKDCEDYVQTLLDRAELSDDPNAWPVIHTRLKKQFPLEEWEDPKSE